MKKILKSCMLAVMTAALALTGCGKDNNPEDLVLQTGTAEVSVGETTTVTITSGNGGYSAASSSPAVAQATVEGKVVTINGVAAGTATVTVKDREDRTATIAVTVIRVEDLVLETGNVDLTTEEVKTVSITSGNGGYTVTTSSGDVATATVEGTTVSITAVAAGTATVTVKDAKNKTADIEVTVTESASLSDEVAGSYHGDLLVTLDGETVTSETDVELVKAGAEKIDLRLVDFSLGAITVGTIEVTAIPISKTGDVVTLQTTAQDVSLPSLGLTANVTVSGSVEGNDAKLDIVVAVPVVGDVTVTFEGVKQ